MAWLCPYIRCGVSMGYSLAFVVIFKTPFEIDMVEWWSTQMRQMEKIHLNKKHEQFLINYINVHKQVKCMAYKRSYVFIK